MKFPAKVDIPTIIFGLSMFLCGGNLLYRGSLWNIVLGPERYFVGALFIAIGAYFSYAAFKRIDKE